MVRRMGSSVRSFRRFVTAIVVLIAFPTCLVFAQTSTATILGVVKDTSGALVPGVSITVKHTESGLTRTVVSGETCGYNAPLLPVGAYEITTTMPGFKQQVRSGINLVVGQDAVVNLTLEVGAIAEQVTVTEEAPLVNTTTSSTSGVITEQQIKELPLNGRSFDQLITLNTGVSNATSNTLDSGAWNMFSVAGKRCGNSTFSRTPTAPEYGKRAGGQINIVTSSGSNQVHGSVFEYLRNSALDARNFFDQTTGAPPFKRNQFGGSLGGPLKKDKMFLFGTYEGFQERLSRSSASVVPGTSARKGLLWPDNSLGLPAGSPVPGLKPEMLKYANNFGPAPSTPDRPDGSAIAYSNPPQTIGENLGLARFDYVISSKDSFSANLTVNNGLRVNPWGGGGGGAPNFKSVSDIISKTLSLKETHVFSSTL